MIKAYYSIKRLINALFVDSSYNIGASKEKETCLIDVLGLYSPPSRLDDLGVSIAYFRRKASDLTDFIRY